MKRVVLLLRKDLRVLLRSPLLLGVLVAYPLLVAGLVGLVAGYGSSKPRVALVDEDHLPRVAHVGGHSFRIQDAIGEVGKNVHLVRMDPVKARHALATGRVVATLTVPPGFLADLRSGLHAPSLVYQTTRGGISSRVTQQVQASVKRDSYDRSNVWFEAGRIQVYDKKNRMPKMKHIDYGLGVLRADALADWPRDTAVDLAEIYKALVERGQLAGYEVRQRFYEIGSHTGLQELEQFLRASPVVR